MLVVSGGSKLSPSSGDSKLDGILVGGLVVGENGARLGRPDQTNRLPSPLLPWVATDTLDADVSPVPRIISNSANREAADKLVALVDA